MEEERSLYLEERIAKLEQESNRHNLDPFWNNQTIIGLRNRIASLERAVYNCTPDALKEPITAKDVDRWRAIEAAAGHVLFTWTKYGLGTKETGSMAIAALQDAVQK